MLEVLPPVDADKGTAVRALLEERQLRRALYAGDDATDLDAFRGLDGLDLVVRVAVVSDEGPTDLGEAADIVVGDPMRSWNFSALSSDVARLQLTPPVFHRPMLLGEPPGSPGPLHHHRPESGR